MITKQKFIELAKAQFGDNPPTVLLAVSGGVDSICLWHLLRQAGIPHQIAHLNYQLRGVESDADQHLVKKLAENHQIRAHFKTVDTARLAKERKSGIQELAREIRYAFFEEVMQAENIQLLITAHHLDDSIETFFINLIRGAGLRGLSGIRDQQRIWRPFLNFTKAEIRAYAKSHQIEYREDASNVGNGYLRNWLRNELLDSLKQKYPSFQARMSTNLQHIQEDLEVLDYFLDRELEKRSMLIPEELSYPFKIPLEGLNDFQFPLALLRKILLRFDFSHQQINDIYDAYQKRNVGARISTQAHHCWFDRDQLILEELSDDEPDRIWPISEFPFQIDQPLEISMELIETFELDHTLPNTEYLDADQLDFPLLLRPWDSGDRMQPLGMRGSKKISDILIDEKVPRTEKNKAMVLLSNQNIVWLLGYRIAESVKISEKTQNILRIRWEKN